MLNYTSVHRKCNLDISRQVSPRHRFYCILSVCLYPLCLPCLFTLCVYPVCLPISRMYSKMGVAVQMVTIWLFGIMVCIICPVTGLWGGFTYDPLLYSCTFDDQAHISYMRFMVSLGFVVPSVFITSCYMSIFIFVQLAKRRVNSWGQTAAKVTRSRSSVPHIPINKVDPGLVGMDPGLAGTNPGLAGTDPGLPSLSDRPGEGELPLVCYQSFWIMILTSFAGHHVIQEATKRREDEITRKEQEGYERDLMKNGITNMKVVLSYEDNTSQLNTEMLKGNGKVNNQDSTQGQNNGSGNDSAPKPRPRYFTALNKQTREAVRLTIMMMCAFVVCAVVTVPYFLVHLFNDKPHFPTAYLVSIMLVSTGMFSNPILFGVMNGQYRRAYKTLLIQCYNCSYLK